MRGEESPVSLRPPIGFIVEGHCEYHAYPSIIAKITGNRYLNIRIENARGSGSILRRLEEHLDDLVKVWHPYSVIITTDLWETIKEGIFESCADLCKSLNKRIWDWLNMRRGADVFSPLPNDIEVVIQIQSFETWLVSDIEGLRMSGMFRLEDNLGWGNVDDEVPNPCHWLRMRQLTTFDIKNPRTAATLASFFKIPNMVNSSKSFSKFYREVTRKYQSWVALLSTC